MMCDYIYIINWKIVGSGKVKEFVTITRKNLKKYLKI